MRRSYLRKESKRELFINETFLLTQVSLQTVITDGFLYYFMALKGLCWSLINRDILNKS